MEPLPVFFVLLFAVLFYRTQFVQVILYEGPRDSSTDELFDEAFWRFLAAEERLQKWQGARPLLHAGQSAYARSLVQEMIATYKLMLICDEEMEDLLLAQLYALLDDPPPSYDPPVATKPLSGGLLFILS